MSEAVIVALARTPFARSGSGPLNLSHGAALAAPVLRAALERAGVEPGELEELLLGCAQPEGATGANIARQAALRAGLPPGVGGITVSRGAASGLEAVALAAQRIAAGDAALLAAGGVESPSCVQREANTHMLREAWLARHHPECYAGPLEAAARIAQRHGIAIERLEVHAAGSRRRAVTAREAGRFADEIVPLTVRAGVVDAALGPRTREVVVSADDPAGDAAGIAALPPAGAAPEAGPVALPADGAALCVLTGARHAERRGLRPWGRCLGFASAGCEPGEAGLGAVNAVRRLLQRLALHVEDIDLWELHESSSAQVLLCADRLGLPPERLNVDGGALALGSPDGASGARLLAHALAEGRRRKARHVCVVADAGPEIGVAGVFEVF
ncbi:acetyl-CoA C-acyltransferase [Caldimonas tepidiphila]|uniref:acetyl-CoA C-acyltransferase n=1 Tax=Caldimonas tepidiphila TaxID=2315841 RepID=UPI000E5A9FA2|nr:acetyl-CoA C-acyltransferase [Caldimonas tepidiphila]